MRQQPQASTTSNHANGTGIYQNNPQFQNISPQEHSQQGQPTLGTSPPTLMVNNPHLQAGLQSQQEQPSALVPPMNQPANSQVTPQQFNQQFQQPPAPQVSPLMAQPSWLQPSCLTSIFFSISTCK